MRNIFDQYSQPENRVTHALLTAINEDRKLLGHFLQELVGVKAPVDPSKLSVLEQQYPGDEEPTEEELERRGIPDGWIFHEESGWCVFIETKVMSKLDADQLNRHRRTVARRGFESITAVAIAPVIPGSLPADTVSLEWKRIFSWLRRHDVDSQWATKAADYLEIAESKLVATGQFREGTLTMFLGFPFTHDRPFSYLEGKRVLALALSELRKNQELIDGLGMNPKAPSRPAITGRQGDGVWDFLSLSPISGDALFTKYPHLTLNVSYQAIEAMVTVPHAVNNAMRRNLVAKGEVGFQVLIEHIVNNLRPLLHHHGGAAPWFRGIQRRYPSQRATPFVDARIDFDLRTAVSEGGLPKMQPRWLSAAYGSFVNKENSNYQIQIGTVFRYDRCPELRQPDAIGLIAKAWLACRPLIELVC